MLLGERVSTQKLNSTTNRELSQTLQVLVREQFEQNANPYAVKFAVLCYYCAPILPRVISVRKANNAGEADHLDLPK